jgi:deoxyguanosine kinase
MEERSQSNVETLLKSSGKIISIEGNIGSGKSTLLRRLSEWPILNIIQEDVDTWKDEGWLELFYSDLKRYSGTFQLRTQISHIENKNKFHSDLLNIIERSPLSNKYIFGKMLFEDGFLHPKEYDIIGKLNDLIGWKPDALVVLLCDPEICHQRIKKRNREGENIPSIDYLKSLHQKHLDLDNELKDIKIIYIDTTNKTPEELENIFIDVIHKIL